MHPPGFATSPIGVPLGVVRAAEPERAQAPPSRARSRRHIIAGHDQLSFSPTSLSVLGQTSYTGAPTVPTGPCPVHMLFVWESIVRG